MVFLPYIRLICALGSPLFACKLTCVDFMSYSFGLFICIVIITLQGYVWWNVNYLGISNLIAHISVVGLLPQVLRFVASICLRGVLSHLDPVTLMRVFSVTFEPLHLIMVFFYGL